MPLDWDKLLIFFSLQMSDDATYFTKQKLKFWVENIDFSPKVKFDSYFL